MPFPKHLIKEWGKDLGWKCEHCGKRWSEGWILEGHHKTPTHNFGADTRDNFVLLCQECHEKAHRLLAQRDSNSANIIKGRLTKSNGRWKP